jgi:cobyrinic acid a,c-diamide synthase
LTRPGQPRRIDWLWGVRSIDPRQIEIREKRDSARAAATHFGASFTVYAPSNLLGQSESGHEHFFEVAMRHLPRFAVGTIQPGACRKAAVWGLVAALAKLGERPVWLRSSLEIGGSDAAQVILGRASRHLDSWAMSRSDAISALMRATGQQDMAIVDGVYDEGAPSGEKHASSLDRLCQWLDLQRIAIVDVRELAARGFAGRPGKLEGIFLDRVADVADGVYWQTTLETLWKTPVVGWLDEAAPLRASCHSVLPTQQPSTSLCEELGKRVLPALRLSKLKQIAERAAGLAFEPEAWLQPSREPFRIAVAMDEAFRGYYPETLDLLEEAGAELFDFSPLRSERIPDHVELVYFGQADMEYDPELLAANHCLKQSLTNFAAEGGRVFAQGSGLAYLCRDAVLTDGRSVVLTGLLPATAHATGRARAVEATEATFAEGSWLAPADVSIRGYRYDGWQIKPNGPVIPYAVSRGNELDILGRGNVIGSRVLIDLAANRHLLRRFIEPYMPVLSSVRRNKG